MLRLDEFVDLFIYSTNIECGRSLLLEGYRGCADGVFIGHELHCQDGITSTLCRQVSFNDCVGPWPCNLRTRPRIVAVNLDRFAPDGGVVAGPNVCSPTEPVAVQLHYPVVFGVGCYTNTLPFSGDQVRALRRWTNAPHHSFTGNGLATWTREAGYVPCQSVPVGRNDILDGVRQLRTDLVDLLDDVIVFDGYRLLINVSTSGYTMQLTICLHSLITITLEVTTGYYKCCRRNVTFE